MNINKLFWNYFVLANYSRARGLPCSAVDTLSETPWRKLFLPLLAGVSTANTSLSPLCLD